MEKREKTGGRKKGTPNLHTATLKTMIESALTTLGGEEYLVQQGRENPQAFISLLGRTLPKDLNLSTPQSMIVSLNGKGIAPPA